MAMSDSKTGDGGTTPQKFLRSWHDALAGTKCYSGSMCLTDLDGTGEHRLLCATEDKRLRVYSGTDMSSEHFVLEEPSAIVAYYPDESLPAVPSVAVAGNSFVFIYRNMRPYFKFSLPALSIDEEEKKTWAMLKEGALNASEAIDKLRALQDSGVQLTYPSAHLAALDGDDAERYAGSQSRHPLRAVSVVTSMAVLKKDRDEPTAVGCLVVGAEDGTVYVLSPSGAEILRRARLPSPPVKIVATGKLDTEYRILVATRDSCVYTLRNIDSGGTRKMEVSGMRITLESPVVGLVAVGRQAIVGCMDNSVHCFHIKGKKLWSMDMPASIVAMEHVEIASSSVIKAYAIALSTGELRLYNDKKVVIAEKATGSASVDPIVGLKFGKYSREDHCLVLSHASGALSVRIIARKTDYTVQGLAGPPPEQDIPLPIPKKTKLYVEQTQRERDNAIAMHRLFQRQLCKLRLDTARSYVSMITDGRGPSTYVQGTSLRINAQVEGLGPTFRLKITLNNSGSKAITGLGVIYMYPRALYSMKAPLVEVPALLPTLTYKMEAPIECIDPEGGAGKVRVVMVRPDTCVPVLSAVVDMPVSQTGDETV